jgi:hypothetical protein
MQKIDCHSARGALRNDKKDWIPAFVPKGYQATGMTEEETKDFHYVPL